MISALTTLLAVTAIAQKTDSIPKKQYHTQRLTGNITLDGKPDEEAWNAIAWGGDFIQWQPNEGKPPSQPTNFKILYDDRFLYIAYRAWDNAKDSIDSRMGRRDEFPGDWVEINIDSYHDLRTAFSFTLSVSGVRSDEFVSNDGNNWDPSWNPIWFAKTEVDAEGWTGEVKIPFSQLRYGNETNKVWGIQVTRRLFRKEERSTWQYIPQNSAVWVSRFGELHGLKDIPFHRQVEIAPYVTGQMDTYKQEPGNPFATGTDKKINAGLDGKVAVTNDLILDFTINPDFGQVEADPSQVRLDGYQVFFQERRPFFIESRNIFDYKITGSIAGGDYDSDLLFYSRRIGSAPHGSPTLTNGEYIQYPQNTAILGAAKFSGKTKKGWSIGVLESVTQRENAIIDKAGTRRKVLVEPLTNYFVGRLQKDIQSGNTIIGGIFTAVNREKGMEHLLHKSAYTGGFDFLQYWNNRTWYLKANLIYSHVNGTKEAILRTQTSFEHLFQRPGAPEAHVDSNRTSLTGLGGTFSIGKGGGKRGKYGQVWKFESGITFRSPQLELNDVGFMLATNEINHFTWIGLHFPKSFMVFRNAGINYNHWGKWDYSGRFLYHAVNVNGNVSFNNNWSTGSSIYLNTYDISNTALRGSSAIRKPGALGISGWLSTDSRKKVSFGLDYFTMFGEGDEIGENSVGLSMNLQPINAVRLNLSASYGYYWRQQDMFVANIPTPSGTERNIVAGLSQKTLRFTARLTVNITPELTIQYYGQPFITRPTYKSFGYVWSPLADKYNDRFYVYQPSQISQLNGSYQIDENGDGTTDYSFGIPDFNYVQFRSNCVVRWEYKPGSELYFVWSQGVTDVSNEMHTDLFKSLADNAFANEARNIFMIKATYRFLR